MSDKMLDGIKKISKEDLANSRQVILDTIGEKAEIKETAVSDKFSFVRNNRLMDGLFKTEAKTNVVPPEKQVVAPAMPEIKKQWAEQIKTVINPVKKTETPKQAKPAEPVKNDEKIAAIAKAKSEEAGRARSEQERLEKIKLRQATEQEKKNRQEYKKMRRQKLIIDWQRRLKALTIYWRYKLPQHFLNIGKLSLFLLGAAFVVGLFIYLVGAVIILKINPDNKISRLFSSYLIIPALINQDGIIEYYKYQDLKTSLAGCCESPAEWSKQTKLKITRDAVVEKLAQKFNLTNKDRADWERRLSEIIAFDQDINQVGINRIRKIKQLIDNNGEFMAVGAKYGDKIGQLPLSETNDNQLNFYQNLQALPVGKTSNITYTADGYYLFQLATTESQSKIFNYVFVAAKTLNEYLNEYLSNYKYLSLVE